MHRLLLAMAAAALLAACGGDGGKPRVSDPATREETLRETVEDAFTAFKEGEVADFYAHFSDDFHDRCSQENFIGVMAIARIFIAALGEDEGSLTIGDIRFEGDDHAFVAATFKTADRDAGIVSSNGSAEEDDFLYRWVLEDGSWKTDVDDPNPCDLSSDFDGDENDDSAPPNGPGTSREEAVPPGKTVQASDLEVTLLDADLDATEAALAQNEFNEPPVAGSRYVVMRVRVRHAGAAPDTVQVSTSDFKLTGSRNVLYDGFGDTSCGFIDGEIGGEMFLGGELEGIVCFQIPQDETHLILVAQPFVSFEDADRRFLALE